jgi:hypothetical protein
MTQSLCWTEPCRGWPEGSPSFALFRSVQYRLLRVRTSTFRQDENVRTTIKSSYCNGVPVLDRNMQDDAHSFSHWRSALVCSPFKDYRNDLCDFFHFVRCVQLFAHRHLNVLSSVKGLHSTIKVPDPFSQCQTQRQ